MDDRKEVDNQNWKTDLYKIIYDYSRQNNVSANDLLLFYIEVIAVSLDTNNCSNKFAKELYKQAYLSYKETREKKGKE